MVLIDSITTYNEQEHAKLILAYLFDFLIKQYSTLHMQKAQQNLEYKSSSKQSDDQTAKLLATPSSEKPQQQFKRQRNIAQQCCNLGRKHLKDKQYQLASKQFSKAVMAFEYIVKNNMSQKQLKLDIATMLNQIIIPAYSNLSLCYLKMQNYEMVISFANQVLNHDSGNVKNLYRRAIAHQKTKSYHSSIEDFEKVARIDESMKNQCEKYIIQTKRLRRESKLKEKEIAKRLITGYSIDIPQQKIDVEPKLNTNDSQYQKIQNKSLKERAKQCLFDCCLKMASYLRKRN